MKLVDNWRRAHRMISVQLMAVVAAVQAAWPQIPDDLRAALPPSLIHWISIALVAAAIFGRLLDQGSTTAPKE